MCICTIQFGNKKYDKKSDFEENIKYFLNDKDTGESSIWLMLHSGSRRIGNHTASYHENIAKNNYGLQGAPLYWLPIDSKYGQEYLNDMQICQEYAYKNRQYIQ